LGVTTWHASCQENLERAMADVGHPDVRTPQPINLFMDVRVEPDGSLVHHPSPALAGDHVILSAEMDCFVVASACPQDLTPINHGRPTSVAMEVLTQTPPSP